MCVLQSFAFAYAQYIFVSSRAVAIDSFVAKYQGEGAMQFYERKKKTLIQYPILFYFAATTKKKKGTFNTL